MYIRYNYCNGSAVFHIPDTDYKYRILMNDFHYNYITPQDADKYQLMEIVPFRPRHADLLHAYNDLHEFLDTLYICLRKSDMIFDKETLTFFNQCLPRQYRYGHKTMEEREKLKKGLPMVISPREALALPYFDCYRITSENQVDASHDQILVKYKSMFGLPSSNLSVSLGSISPPIKQLKDEMTHKNNNNNDKEQD
jgi:hypothetical protein